jgi:GTP cyclohydrolase I
MCAHHLLPFFGRAHVAFLPAERSDRLRRDRARRRRRGAEGPRSRRTWRRTSPTRSNARLPPRGVAVLLEGRHLCMEMRGRQQARAHGDCAVARARSSARRRARAEFLERVRRRPAR